MLEMALIDLIALFKVCAFFRLAEGHLSRLWISDNEYSLPQETLI